MPFCALIQEADFSPVLNLKEIMKKYNVYRFASASGALEALCKDLIFLDSFGQPLEKDKCESLAGVLTSLCESCESLGVDPGITEQIKSIAEEHRAGTADLRAAVVRAKLRIILDAIEQTLLSRKFFLLSEEEASFYNAPALFGQSFKEKYPARAMRESFDAGNSYAASLYTACVFHCMRVAEYGLRKLAGNSFLKIKLTQKKGKPHPIDYADWQKVIDGIRSKITKIRQRPVGPKRETELQFFSNAADHCEYMKDIWRNELSHTRRAYEKEEALAVINRVKDFVTVVGEHRGSLPAADSIMRVIEQAQQKAVAELAASTIPSLPSSV